MIAPADLKEILARTPLPALISRRVKLARSGREWVGCCPFHGEKTPSFYVYPDHFHCYGCGAHGDAFAFIMQVQGVGFSDAAKMLANESGVDTMPAAAVLPAPSPAPRATKPCDPPTAAFALAMAIWSEARPALCTPVETYLAERGCGDSAPDCLRFHPACPRGNSERLPAMVALMTDPASNQPIGIHRTYLRADGCGKVQHGTAKMMLGNAGVIRLTPDEEITTGLGIVEGIETGLGIMHRAAWRAVWATGSAGGIKKFPVLSGIECLTIFPDRDDSGVGQDAADFCADQWRSAGREARLIWPPAGCDWLDALIAAAA